ncbi:MAG: HAMP domain-containing protein [Alphaproteobacteria bacterium]|nr:HAMP domain-containing protein [Alphaproteobacteria bacterium]
MSITKKIFGITFLVASLAVAIIAMVTLDMGRDALRDLGRRRLVESVAREAQMLQNRLDILRDDIVLQSSQDTFRGLNLGPTRDVAALSPPILRQLRLLMEKRPDYLEVAILQGGEWGERILRVRREADGLTQEAFSDRDIASEYPVYPEMLSLWPGNVHFPALERRSRDGAPSVLVGQAGTRLADVVGRAVLLVTVDADALIGTLAVRDDISFFVADRMGRYLAGPPGGTGPDNLLDAYGLRESWAGWMAQHDPRLYAEVAGRTSDLALQRIVVGDPMNANGPRHLVVGGISSLADIEMEVATFGNRLAGLSVGLGAFLALTLALAITYLARPLNALTRVAEQIAGGSSDVTFPTLPADEIGRLAEVMRRMLEALRVSAKNEEQAALGHMATMIAHDVRNALSSVKMNLRILAEQNCQPGCDENCRIGLRQVAYMESVLDDMLAFAQPHELRLDWIDMGEAIRTALVSMLPETRQKQITVIEGKGLSSLPKLLGDRTKLLRALQNLLANAAQAMSTGGTLAVMAGSVLHDSSPAVEIVIADDGDGVPPEAAGRVFEPFFTTRAKGTGLGLAIVQRIVRAHGGTVELAPRTGGGTEARVVLPVTPHRWEA